MDTNQIDLVTLIRDIEQYDAQFGIGALIKSVVSGTLPDEPGVMDFVIGSQISMGDLGRKYEDVLKATGLSLEAVESSYVIPNEENTSAPRMQINLADGSTFVQYLDSLSKETITPDQKKALEAVANSFTRQLAQKYKLNDPTDERVIDLFGQLEQVIEGYEKLGLSPSTEVLSEYLKIARDGYLIEHITVERSHLFTGRDHFGPATWHTDMAPEQYSEKWGNALATLDDVSVNPNAAGLAQKLKAHLKESAEYAIQEINADPTAIKLAPRIPAQGYLNALNYAMDNLK